MPHPKNNETEQFKRLLLESNDVFETDRADSGLTTLSFQSNRTPNLHVWVDTDLAGQLVIDLEDLEDWQNNERWDNSVAHLAAPNIEIGVSIALAWLNGQGVEACRQLGGVDLR